METFDKAARLKRRGKRDDWVDWSNGLEGSGHGT